jgi:hypothetical protein
MFNPKGYNRVRTTNDQITFEMVNWYGEGEDYFGTNKELMTQLIMATLELEKHQDIYDNRMKDLDERSKRILIEKIGPCPKWEAGKSNSSYNKWHGEFNKIKSSDPEYDEIKELCTWRRDNPYRKAVDDLTYKCAESDAKAFFADNKEKHIKFFEYSDNDGTFGCVMEHGDIFNKLKNIRFSHH